MREKLNKVSQQYGSRSEGPPLPRCSGPSVGSVLGGIIGVAAMDTEGARDFLTESLHGIKALVGIDTYRKAFP